MNEHYSVHLQSRDSLSQQQIHQQLQTGRQNTQQLSRQLSRQHLHHQQQPSQPHNTKSSQPMQSTLHHSSPHHTPPQNQQRPNNSRPSHQKQQQQRLSLLQHIPQHNASSQPPPPQPPPQYTQQNNTRNPPPQYTQQQMQYSSQRFQITSGANKSTNKLDGNAQINNITTNNDEYSNIAGTNANANSGINVERNCNNNYPVLVKNLRTTLTLTPHQPSQPNQKVHRFTISHQSSPTAPPPANTPRNISSRISPNIIRYTPSEQHRSASANPCTSSQVLNLKRSESIPELIHCDNLESKSINLSERNSLPRTDSAFNRSISNTSIIGSPRQTPIPLSTIGIQSNNDSIYSDTNNQPISMVKPSSNSQTPSNFRSATILKCRGFLTFKHCVRKKPSRMSSSSDETTPMCVEKRIQRLNRRVKRKKKKNQFVQKNTKVNFVLDKNF